MTITPIIQWELESIVSWGTETIRVEEGDYIEVHLANCNLIYTGYVNHLNIRGMRLEIEYKNEPRIIDISIKDIENIKMLRKVYIKY